MRYTIHNDSSSMPIDTHLQGRVTCGYDRLVELFGDPGIGDGYKTDAEWIIRFDDGTVATIYNWKNGRSYLGESAPPVTEIRSWNVGGHSCRAYLLVGSLLGPG